MLAAATSLSKRSRPRSMISVDEANAGGGEVGGLLEGVEALWREDCMVLMMVLGLVLLILAQL